MKISKHCRWHIRLSGKCKFVTMEPILKLFVAGSKELKSERMVCRSVCNVLQNQWGTILTKTYEDFPEVLSTEGHQTEYNRFICESADVAIFIFSGIVGNITLDEFKCAWESFKSGNHPEILVYIDKGVNAHSEAIDKLKAELSDMRQYYLEYSNLEELETLVEKHLSKLLVRRDKSGKRSEIKPLKLLSVSGIIFGVWLLLALIGGIGMYIYDRFMDDDECLAIASKYVETGRRGEELIYYLPDATFVYDITTKQLDKIPRENSSSSLDISIGKIEHATLGVTASLLLARLFTVKVKSNAKTMLGYAALAAASAIGFGVGCVVEQMIFPPQYSAPVEKFLSDPANWEKMASGRKPNWF